MTETPSIQQCPVCSRLVQFLHKETTLVQCSCGAVLQRKEGALVSKPFYIIQRHASVIQPGTAGKWNGKTFTVIGRFRAWMQESVFNYWTILFEDNAIGYLGEGYGLYAIYEKAAVEHSLTTALLNGFAPGTQCNLYKGGTLLLERKYTCHKWEMEGEIYLPDSAPTFRTFDFAAPDGRHIEAIAFQNNQVYLFHVYYTSFDSLALTNTRNWEPYIKELHCAQCSAQNVLKTYPYAHSYACVRCSARYALQESGSFKRSGQHNKTDTGTNITLGASATLKGILYEVVGFALKEESNIERAQWKEYTLFNPQEGFAFLSEYNGHWVYAREQGDTPVLEREGVTEFTYDKEPFHLFNKNGYQTASAAGEFPYNPFNDSDKVVREYISPPEMWIKEKSSKEGINWFLGEHIPRSTLAAALGDSLIMPGKVGVGAIEPKGFVNPLKLAALALAGALILVFAHTTGTTGLQKRIISAQHYSFDTLNTVSFVTPKFHLDKWRSNLQFDVEAPVDNSWLEMNATLVNAATGTEYSIEKGVEYYHGYSEGEPWSEGDTRETVFLSSIPAGTYYLQINGMRESRYSGYGLVSHQSPDGFYLTVTYDTPNDRNLGVCLIALAVIALIQYQVAQYHEKRRWSNSPFSPYES
jgi:hypothetical protein